MIPFLFVFAGLKYAFAIFISLLVALRTRVLRMNWLWALPAMLMALSAVQVQAPFWRYILSGPSIGGLLEIALPALVLGFFGLYTPPPVGANAEGARDRIARVVAATGLVWLSPAYLLSDLQGFPTDRFAGPFIDWLGHVRWYPLGALPPTLLVYAGFGYLLVRSFSDPGRARSLASPGMGRG